MKTARLAVGAVAVTVALAGCGGGKPAPSAKGATTTGTSTAGTTPSTTTSGATPRGVSPPSREVAPGVVRAVAEGVSATMRASTHHPTVNRAWPVSFTVTKAGKPVQAEVSYQYLFAGQVVARRSHYRFTKTFHDVFQWPSSAVGYPLTFRAVISATDVTLNLDYAIQVKR